MGGEGGEEEKKQRETDFVRPVFSMFFLCALFFVFHDIQNTDYPYVAECRGASRWIWEGLAAPLGAVTR